MRGSVANQVNTVFSKIIHIGESKHVAKSEARSEGAKTWHEIGKNLDIYSYKTADAYRDVAKQAFEYIKQEFGVKDITKLQGEHVQAFLESKIEEGIKYSTFQQYAAALEKLETALSKYTGQEYNFSKDIAEARAEAQAVLERTDAHRAYETPRELIRAIDRQDFKTIATAQYESGARIHELNHLKLEQFKENSIEVQGKGGKIREIELSEKTYNALKSLVENSPNQKLTFDTNAYRNELKQASERTNQEYQGSHGLRWNFAQERFTELQEKGLSYEQALSEVSQLLGHERPDITEHYLR